MFFGISHRRQTTDLICHTTSFRGICETRDKYRDQRIFFVSQIFHPLQARYPWLEGKSNKKAFEVVWENFYFSANRQFEKLKAKEINKRLSTKFVVRTNCLLLNFWFKSLGEVWKIKTFMLASLRQLRMWWQMKAAKAIFVTFRRTFYKFSRINFWNVKVFFPMRKTEFFLRKHHMEKCLLEISHQIVFHLWWWYEWATTSKLNLLNKCGLSN